MTLPGYDDWLDNHGLPGIDDGEDIMCQCEHTDHDTGSCAHGDVAWHGQIGKCLTCGAEVSTVPAKHSYLGVMAGEQRAHLVGPICDACADTHMSGYLIRE